MPRKRSGIWVYQGNVIMAVEPALHERTFNFVCVTLDDSIVRSTQYILLMIRVSFINKRSSPDIDYDINSSHVSNKFWFRSCLIYIAFNYRLSSILYMVKRIELGSNDRSVGEQRSVKWKVVGLNPWRTSMSFRNRYVKPFIRMSVLTNI